MALIQKTTRAFSLIELIVAVGILALISTIVLANHTKFNGSVLLGSLAYDIGLSIREAQVFGVSVRQYNNDFQLGYGVYFEAGQAYSLFADVNRDRVYDSEDSIIRSYGLQKGFVIQKFCGITSENISYCSTDASDPITHLSVVFLRPEPDAFISSNKVGILYSRGTITVMSPGGETRTVDVASTGQISIQNP